MRQRASTLSGQVDPETFQKMFGSMFGGLGRVSAQLRSGRKDLPWQNDTLASGNITSPSKTQEFHGSRHETKGHRRRGGLGGFGSAFPGFGFPDAASAKVRLRGRRGHALGFAGRRR